MAFELIKLSFDKIMQTHSYTVVVMTTGEKRFAIYIDPTMGKTLQLYLTGMHKQRPLTHDLISLLLLGMSAHIKQIVINDIQDTVYYARLFIEQQKGAIKHILEIDARPSDCITLALMNNAPVYCTKDVLQKTIPLED